MDVVVTVPKNFTDWSSDGLHLRGLAAWIYEGDATRFNLLGPDVKQ